MDGSAFSPPWGVQEYAGHRNVSCPRYNSQIGECIVKRIIVLLENNRII